MPVGSVRPSLNQSSKDRSPRPDEREKDACEWQRHFDRYVPRLQNLKWELPTTCPVHRADENVWTCIQLYYCLLIHLEGCNLGSIDSHLEASKPSAHVTRPSHQQASHWVLFSLGPGGSVGVDDSPDVSDY